MLTTNEQLSREETAALNKYKDERKKISDNFFH